MVPMGPMQKLREAIAERLIPDLPALREAAEIEQADMGQLRESLRELELEDAGWQKLIAGGTQLISAEGRRSAVETSRILYIASPMIKQGIELQSNYVFGRGVEIDTGNPDANQWLADLRQANRKQLGHIGMVEHDHTLSHDGNFFFLCFRNTSTGEVSVRTFDSLQITEIITDPDDSDAPWAYKRQWTQITIGADGITRMVPRTSYYLDIGLASKPPEIAGIATEDAVILHVKEGGVEHWKFGLPTVYAAIDWTREHSRFLKRWAIIQGALSRWALKMKVPGGKKEVAAAKARMQTGIENTSLTDSNPPPLTGSTFIGTEKASLDVLNTRNSTTGPDEARELKLMIAAALGIPEHMFGDPSTSNLATSKTLDRPTELKFATRQRLWAEAYETLFNWALAKGAAAPNSRIRGIKAQTCKVKFPDILEHDLKDDIAAIISAATLDGKPLADTIPLQEVSAMLLRRLGFESEMIEEIHGQIFAADGTLINPRQAQPNAAQAGESAAVLAMVDVIGSLKQAIHEAEHGNAA